MTPDPSQNSWDVAGGSILIEEAGGMMTDMEGNPYSLATRAIIGSNKLVSSAACAGLSISALVALVVE